MRERPTVMLLHGGPGSYDQSRLPADHLALLVETFGPALAANCPL
jgi:hypothetical protein